MNRQLHPVAGVGRRAVAGFALLLAATAIAACGGDSLPEATRPDPNSAQAEANASSAQVAVPTANDGRETHHHDFAQEGVLRIGHLDARYAFDVDVATFVDVRSVENYEAAHIPGARSIPLSELPDRISELDPARIIITYCT